MLARLRGITESFYNKKREEYRDKQKLIEEKLGSLREADEEYYLTAMRILKVANQGPEIFESSEPEARRQVLKILLQNCVVNDATLIPQIRSPFSLFAKGASRLRWLADVDAKRTTQRQLVPLLIRMRKWRGAHRAKLIAFF